MRAWRRGACAAVVGLALLLTTLPASAEPEAAPSEGAPFAILWQRVSDLWGSLSATWSPITGGETATAPIGPGEAGAGEAAPGACDSVCTEQSHDIDPNG